MKENMGEAVPWIVIYTYYLSLGAEFASLLKKFTVICWNFRTIYGG